MVGAVLVVLLLSVAFTVVLYLLIRDEPASTTVTNRESAERDAQRFGGVESRGVRPPEASRHEADDGDEEDRPWGDSRLEDEHGRR